MKKRILLVLALVSAAGCVDTPDSVCREFLNANNEHIDALMMVTSERQALNMSVRVFSKMNERYQALDKKWEIMDQGMGNKPSLETIKEFFDSDGMHLYRAEYKINAQRCTLELARIRKLLEQTVEHAKEQARANGEDPDEIKSDRWPTLHKIVHTKSFIDVLRIQLENPKLENMLSRFNGRLDLAKSEDKAVLKIFQEKNNRFNNLMVKDGKVIPIEGKEPIALAR
jgi:hypothetical protein